MARVAVALLGSALTAAYWWAVFAFVHARVLFAGDRGPAYQPPPDREVVFRNGAALVIGVLVYAVLGLAWQRMMGTSRRQR